MIGPHVGRDYFVNLSRKEADNDSRSLEEGRMSIAKHIEAATKEAAMYGYKPKTFQIFVAGPQKLKIRMESDEIDELHSYIKKTKIRVIAHSAFAAYPWKGKPYPPIFIKKELKVCKRAGIDGLVVHLGKPQIPEVIKVIPSLMMKDGPKIFLETPSLKPTSSHYVLPKDIGNLFKAIRTFDPKLKCFGLCIDSAHIWASGVDIQSYDLAKNWLEELMAEGIPAENIIIHLNDSKTPLGSGIDKHDILLEGCIWGNYIDNPKESGMYAFIDFSHKYQVPIILERCDRDELIRDYCTIKSI